MTGGDDLATFLAECGAAVGGGAALFAAAGLVARLRRQGPLQPEPTSAGPRVARGRSRRLGRPYGAVRRLRGSAVSDLSVDGRKLMGAMRKLAMYPAAAVTTTIVCVFAGSQDWGDVTTYTVLFAVSLLVIVPLNLWIDAPRRRRSGPPHVG